MLVSSRIKTEILDVAGTYVKYFMLYDLVNGSANLIIVEYNTCGMSV